MNGAKDTKRRAEIVYALKPHKPGRSVFSDVVLPNGTTIRRVDETVHEKALKAASKRFKDKNRLMRDVSGAEELKDYNKVLEAFVDDSGDSLDIVGLVAYALSKRQKRDWIVGYRAGHDGRRPSGAEVDAVTSSYLSEDLRDTLRKRASEILSDYAEVYVDAVTPQVREAALASETLRQAQDIERSIRSNSGFWRQVGTGIVATGIWTLVVFALVLTALALGSDFVDMWQTINAKF